MELIGTPFAIQNSSEGWVVTWREAVKDGVPGKEVESVSFTVKLPRRADLSIEEVQTYALKRAAELLQIAIQKRAP